MSRYLLEREPRRVACFSTTNGAFDVDGTSSVILDLADAHASFTVSTKSHYIQNFTILGTSGRIEMQVPIGAFRDAEVSIYVTNRQGTRRVRFGPQDQWARELEVFSDCILDGSPLPVSVDDSIANQTAVDAILEAADSGRWVLI
jgi:predicted dehydrogenase